MYVCCCRWYNNSVQLQMVYLKLCARRAHITADQLKTTSIGVD